MVSNLDKWKGIPFVGGPAWNEPSEEEEEEEEKWHPPMPLPREPTPLDPTLEPEVTGPAVVQPTVMQPPTKPAWREQPEPEPYEEPEPQRAPESYGIGQYLDMTNLPLPVKGAIELGKTAWRNLQELPQPWDEGQTTFSESYRDSPGQRALAAQTATTFERWRDTLPEDVNPLVRGLIGARQGWDAYMEGIDYERPLSMGIGPLPNVVGGFAAGWSGEGGEIIEGLENTQEFINKTLATDRYIAETPKGVITQGVWSAGVVPEERYDYVLPKSLIGTPEREAGWPFVDDETGEFRVKTGEELRAEMDLSLVEGIQPGLAVTWEQIAHYLPDSWTTNVNIIEPRREGETTDEHRVRLERRFQKYTQGYLEVRALVESAIGDHPEADWAFTLASSGAQASLNFLHNLINKEENLMNLQRQRDEALVKAAEAFSVGDDAGYGYWQHKAAQFGAKYRALENMTADDMLWNEAKLGPELMQGIALDLLNFIDFVPFVDAYRAARATYKYTLGTAEAVKNFERVASATPLLLKTAGATGGAIPNKNVARYLYYVAKAGKEFIEEPDAATLGKVLEELTLILARTPESRAALDAQTLFRGLQHVISGVGKPGTMPTAQDAVQILEYITNVSKRADMIKGIPMPSGGVGQWQPGILANRDFADRLPVLDLMRGAFFNPDGTVALKSLAKAAEADFAMNWNWFWSEVYGVLEDGSRTLEGVQYGLKKLPFGASDVKAMPAGDGRNWIVQYLNKEGKVLQSGAPQPQAAATKMVQTVKATMKEGRTFGDWMKLPADVQRAFMSDMFLGLRPAGWWRNAMGATTMLMSSNTWTTRGIEDIIEHIRKLYGYVPEQYMTAAVTDEMGEFATQAITGKGAISWMGEQAEKLGMERVGKGAQRMMQNVYSMPYGLGTIPHTPFQKGEIRLPFGINIPFSEENLRIKSHYIAQMRTLEARWEKFLFGELLPEMQALGVPKQNIDNLLSYLNKDGVTNGLGGLDDVKKYIETDNWFNPLGELDISFEILPVRYQNEIQQLISAYRGSLDTTDMIDFTPLVRDIKGVILKSKDMAAEVLGQVGSGVRPIWTRQEIAFDAEDFVSDLIRTGRQAGIDPVEARQQAERVRDAWVKAQSEANERFRKSLERATGPDAGNENIWNVSMDFWRDMYNHKITARRTSDKAARAAVDTSGSRAVKNAAWQKAWQQKIEAWETYANEAMATVDHYRGVLGRVYRGDQYDANFSWTEVLDRWAKTNFDEINRLMDVTLPAPTRANKQLYQQVIGANRVFADNALTTLFEVFHKFPSMENYDLLVSGMRLVDETGGQVRKYLNGEKERLLALTSGEGLGKYMPEYRQIVNEQWRLYWKFTLPDTYNAYARAMVAHSLGENTPSLLRWFDEFGDTQYQLVGPAAKKGHWDVRDVDTNRIIQMPGEDLQKPGDVARAWDFVPQNVLDDWKKYLSGIANQGKDFVDDTVATAQAAAQKVHPIDPTELAKQNARVTNPAGYQVPYEDYREGLPIHHRGGPTQPRAASIDDIPAGLRGIQVPGPSARSEQFKAGRDVKLLPDMKKIEFEEWQSRLPPHMGGKGFAGEEDLMLPIERYGEYGPPPGADVAPTGIILRPPKTDFKVGDRVLDQGGSGRITKIDPDGTTHIDMDNGETAIDSPGYGLVEYPEDLPAVDLLSGTGPRIEFTEDEAGQMTAWIATPDTSLATTGKPTQWAVETPDQKLLPERKLLPDPDADPRTDDQVMGPYPGYELPDDDGLGKQYTTTPASELDPMDEGLGTIVTPDMGDRYDAARGRITHLPRDTTPARAPGIPDEEWDAAKQVEYKGRPEAEWEAEAEAWPSGRLDKPDDLETAIEKSKIENWSKRGDTPTVEVISFDDYAARKGVLTSLPFVDDSPGSPSKAAGKRRGARTAADMEKHRKDLESLQFEYDNLVEAGYIRKPSHDEAIDTKAAGHPDREDVQAAKRLQKKRETRIAPAPALPHEAISNYISGRDFRKQFGAPASETMKAEYQAARAALLDHDIVGVKIVYGAMGGEMRPIGAVLRRKNGNLEIYNLFADRPNQKGWIDQALTDEMATMRKTGPVDAAQALPEPPTTTEISDNELRRLARLAGVSTASDAGKPIDQWLLNVIKKDTGIDVENITHLTGTDRIAARDALDVRVARVTKALPEEEAAAAPAKGYAIGQRVQTPAGPGKIYAQHKRGWGIELDKGGKRTFADRNIAPEAGKTDAALDVDVDFKPTPEKKPFADLTDEEKAQRVIDVEKKSDREAQDFRMDTLRKEQEARKRPPQEGMFDDTSEDLPIMSGAPVQAKGEGAFKPKPVQKQDALPGMDVRPRMGAVDAFGTPIKKQKAPMPVTPKEAKKLPPDQRLPDWSLADDVNMEIRDLEEAREAMRAEWDRNISTPFGKGKIDTYIARYGRSDTTYVNLNLERGEVRGFEDTYGALLGGKEVRSTDDIQAYLQQYRDLYVEIKSKRGMVDEAGRFKNKSSQEIVDEVRPTLIEVGMNDDDIANLAATSRPNVLEFIEGLPGFGAPANVNLQKGSTYYGAVLNPDALNMLNMVGDKAFWKEVLDNIRRSFGPVDDRMASTAREVLVTLDDAENLILRNIDKMVKPRKNQMSPNQRLRVQDLVNDKAVPRFKEELAIANEVGRETANWNMLNFGDRRNVDTILSSISPYPYFWSRMPARMALASLTKPRIVNNYWEVSDNLAEENKRRQRPDYREGTFALPGEEWLMGNPLLNAIPYGMYLNTNPFMETPTDDASGTEKWLNSLQHVIPGLMPAYKYAYDKYYRGVDPDFMFSDLMPIPRMVGYFNMGQTGTVSSQLGAEHPIMRLGDEWDYGRAGKAIAMMVLQGEITPEMAAWAIDVGHQIRNNVGPLPEQPEEARAIWEQGVKDMAVDRGIALFAAFMIGVPIYHYPQIEHEMRMLKSERSGLKYSKEGRHEGEVGNIAGSRGAQREFDRLHAEELGLGPDQGIPLDAAYGYRQNYGDPEETSYRGATRPGARASQLGFKPKEQAIYDDEEMKKNEFLAAYPEAHAGGDKQGYKLFTAYTEQLKGEREDKMAALEEQHPSRQYGESGEFQFKGADYDPLAAMSPDELRIEAQDRAIRQAEKEINYDEFVIEGMDGGQRAAGRDAYDGAVIQRAMELLQDPAGLVGKYDQPPIGDRDYTSEVAAAEQRLATPGGPPVEGPLPTPTAPATLGTGQLNQSLGDVTGMTEPSAALGAAPSLASEGATGLPSAPGRDSAAPLAPGELTAADLVTRRETLGQQYDSPEEIAFWDAWQAQWDKTGAAIEASRAAVAGKFGPQMGAKFDQYYSYPKGSEQRKRFAAENPDMRAAWLYSDYPAEYGQLEQMFGEDAIMGWARRPAYVDTEAGRAARGEYWDNNPQSYLVNVWLYGKYNPSNTSETRYDFGKDFDEAESRWPGIWTVVAGYKRGWDKSTKSSYFDAHPNLSAFYDWWYDGDSSGSYSRSTRSSGYYGYRSYGSSWGGGGGGGEYTKSIDYGTPKVYVDPMSKELMPPTWGTKKRWRDPPPSPLRKTRDIEMWRPGLPQAAY